MTAPAGSRAATARRPCASVLSLERQSGSVLGLASYAASWFRSKSSACAASASSSARRSGGLQHRRSRPESVAFLPPFDALVSDRGLLGSLFEFEYVWELFFPPSKRRWGWYVLQ